MKIEGMRTNEDMDLEKRLRAFLVSKKPAEPSVITDIDTSIIFANIFSQAKDMDEVVQKEFLEELKGKSYEELREEFFEKKEEEENSTQTGEPSIAA